MYWARYPSFCGCLSTSQTLVFSALVSVLQPCAIYIVRDGCMWPLCNWLGKQCKGLKDYIYFYRQLHIRSNQNFTSAFNPTSLNWRCAGGCCIGRLGGSPHTLLIISPEPINPAGRLTLVSWPQPQDVGVTVNRCRGHSAGWVISSSVS